MYFAIADVSSADAAFDMFVDFLNMGWSIQPFEEGWRFSFNFSLVTG